MNEHLKWIIPILFILIGAVAGIIFEKIILKKLKKFALQAKVPGSHLIFKTLKGIPKILFLLGGLYAALISLQVNNLIGEKIFTVAQQILTSILLFTITLVLARISEKLAKTFTQKNQGVSTSLISNLAKIIVFIIGILIILQTLGISITPLLATLGIGGLAVALAFQETLGNLFSGLYLIISRQVRTGDYVKLEGGQEGYITDITWRNTVIREIPNNLVVVPNSKLGSAIFTNYHLPAKEINVQISVGVSYDSDLEKVEYITLEVAKEVMQEVSAGIDDFEPFLLFEKFGESSIDFTVFLRVNEFLDRRIAKHKFIKRLHRRYKQDGIEIPFPKRDVYIKREQGIGM
ncbi:MAG: mechanosensitive ion channel domain-containing protein [Crinalium sp.]